MGRSSNIKVLFSAASVLRATTRVGAPGLAERAQAVPRLVRATLDGSYAGTTRRRLGLVVAAVAYVVSPLDLLPEAFLPVLGAADDAVVISWALRVFIEETDRFLAWELGQGLCRGSLPVRGAGASTEATVLVPTTTADTVAPAGVPAGGVPAAGVGQGRAASSVRATAGNAKGVVRDAATTYVFESVRKRFER
ncbi:MAG: YkvA family protein [Dermatophilaceae bacterium]